MNQEQLAKGQEIQQRIAYLEEIIRPSYINAIGFGRGNNEHGDILYKGIILRSQEEKILNKIVLLITQEVDKEISSLRKEFENL